MQIYIYQSSVGYNLCVLFFFFFVEPGYYEDGSFGIRLENVVLVVPAKPKVGVKTGQMDVQKCSGSNTFFYTFSKYL